MGANDQHHYVPKFYLRNFSVEGDRATVQIYNHKNQRFIPRASIKGQAREKFLYGKDDEVEKDLGKLESAVAALFHDPITKIIPPVEPESFTLLREFVMIQLFRTKKAADELLNGLNQAINVIAPLLNLKLPEGAKLAHDHPALISLDKAISNLALMNHLAIKSIVNLTEFPFITSDAPIALYNQWMEKQGRYIGATAIAVKGLQIFLPIHPRLVYCLYDPYVYKCGADETLVIKVENQTDVHQINSLQYLFSDSHMYSDNQASPEYLEYIVEQCKTFRIANRSISKIADNNQPPKESEKIFLFNSFEDPHFNLDLSFFEIKQDVNEYLPEDGLPVLRHPSFYELLNKSK